MLQTDAQPERPDPGHRDVVRLDPEQRPGPAHLGDDDLGDVSEILALLRPATFAAGQSIFNEREPGDRVYILHSGIVKIRRRLDGERDHLIAVAGPDDIVGELAVFDPGPHTSTVVAVTNVSAGWLDRATLHSWIVEHPQAGQILLQLLARQVKRRYHQLTDMAGTDAAGRVARQLLYLAARFGVTEADGVRVTGVVTPSELADLAGAPAPVLNRVLEDFAGHGWVRLVDDGVLVTDLAALDSRATRPTGGPR